MDRRTFLAGTGTLLLAAPPVAETQEAKVPKIGVLSLDFPNDSLCVDALRRSLNDLGYAEGRTHALELRWAKDRTDLLPSLAADLVRMKVDLIVSASAPAAVIVKEATTSIPIVLASSFYPVESGVIASLAHPGGNVTGVTHFTPELMAKRVQLLKEVVPKAPRFALLRLPGRLQDLVVRDMEVAARRLGVQLQVIEVRRVEDLPVAFDTAVTGRAQGVMSTQSPFFAHHNVPAARPQEPPAQSLRRAGRGKGRRAPLLRTQCFRGVLTCREVHRPDSQGGQAGRPPGGAAEENRLRHQLEDGEGARADDSPAATRTGR